MSTFYTEKQNIKKRDGSLITMMTSKSILEKELWTPDPYALSSGAKGYATNFLGVVKILRPWCTIYKDTHFFYLVSNLEKKREVEVVTGARWGSFGTYNSYFYSCGVIGVAGVVIEKTRKRISFSQNGIKLQFDGTYIVGFGNGAIWLNVNDNSDGVVSCGQNFTIDHGVIIAADGTNVLKQTKIQI